MITIEYDPPIGLVLEDGDESPKTRLLFFLTLLTEKRVQVVISKQKLSNITQGV